MKRMKRDINFLTQNLIAHRGYHNIKKGIPENSIMAFENAIKHNYLIELDVHILKDGEIVVFHDDNIKRMTGIDREIKDMDYDEIREIKLQETNQRIPLLKEVLKVVDGKVPLIIELKYDVKCGVLEKEVIKILKEYNGKYAIKSFNPFSIIFIKNNFPEAIRGQLATDFKDDNISKIKRIFLSKMLFNFISKPDFISYNINALPNKRVSKIRSNKVILGWTVRNNDNLKKAKKYCDNFICENIDSLDEKEIIIKMNL